MENTKDVYAISTMPSAFRGPRLVSICRQCQGCGWRRGTQRGREYPPQHGTHLTLATRQKCAFASILCHCSVPTHCPHSVQALSSKKAIIPLLNLVPSPCSSPVTRVSLLPSVLCAPACDIITISNTISVFHAAICV